LDRYTGRTLSVFGRRYRQALVQVCKYLKIPYSSRFTTIDLEAEVFLHLLGQVWKKLPEKDKQKLSARVQRQLAKSELNEPLPLSLQRDPLGLLVKGGSALAVTSIVKPLLLKQIARQFAVHFASYQIAQTSYNPVPRLCSSRNGETGYGCECSALWGCSWRVCFFRPRDVGLVFCRFGVESDRD
jgi:hypothetical protein